VHAYVVNLARAADRRAHIIHELQKTDIDYEFVEAVDGRELDLNDSRSIDPTAVSNGSLGDSPAAVPGVVGCAQSHLRVYRKILEDGHERALVLEDDVLLPNDLATLADAVGENMLEAEVVLLQFHHDPAPCRVTKEGSVSLPSSRLLVHPVDTRLLYSAAGYVITRQACQRMERAILPVRVQADSWDFYRRRGAIDGLRCVVPMPIVDSPAFRSTIDYYWPNSIQARLREWVPRARVPVLYQAITYRRQRTLRRKGRVGEFEFVEKEAN
jgi:glycosyl transferase family 25